MVESEEGQVCNSRSAVDRSPTRGWLKIEGMNTLAVRDLDRHRATDAAPA